MPLVVKSENVAEGMECVLLLLLPVCHSHLLLAPSVLVEHLVSTIGSLSCLMVCPNPVVVAVAVAVAVFEDQGVGK